MANTYITSGTSFRPYTFDEMIKPYQMYKEAYDKADTELNTLLEDAAENFSFMPQDTAEKAVYDDIMSRLNDLSGQLSNGLNHKVTKGIRDINKEYRTKMLPIQKKVAKRAELVKQQYTMQAANPNIRFTKDYSKVGLEDITDNSSFSVIDLDAIYKQAATEFGDITSKMYRDNVEITPVGDTGYYNVMQGYGYTPVEFNLSINDKKGAPYDFYKAKADAIDARTDIDDYTKIEMKQAVLRGMSSRSGTFSSYHINGKHNTPSGGDKSNNITDIKVDSNNVGVGVFRGKPVTFKVTGKDENGNWIIDYSTIRTISSSSQEEKDADNAGTTRITNRTDPYGRNTRTVTVTIPGSQPADTTAAVTVPTAPSVVPDDKGHVFGKK